VTRARLLALLAVRSLWAHKVKNAFVGSILAFGTFLVVSGGALLDAVESAMQRSITSSLAGDLQVYDAAAKDKLDLYGGFGGVSDIGEIPQWEVVAPVLSGVDNVEAVVPMALGFATVFGRNEIDVALDGLRSAVTAGDAVGVQEGRQRVARICSDLVTSLDARRAVAAADVTEKESEALARVASDAFWQSFEANPVAELEYLETRLAPLAADGRLLYLRLIGSDLDAFAQSFDSLYIVKGQAVPAGERGILISDRTWEELVKNVVARQMDELYEASVRDGKSIDGDPLLTELVGRMRRQASRILYQLSDAEAASLATDLSTALGTPPGTPVGQLLDQLLDVHDGSILRHHQVFYDVVAPRISLYDLPLGEEMTLRSFTRSGYLRSVNVKIWGTYEFRGLEGAGLQSAGNLVDLITFRDLYGQMSEAQLGELAAIKAAVGVKDIDRASAEDALFGGGGEILTEATSGVVDAPVAVPVAAAQRSTKFDPADQHRGLVLNGALLLKDPSRIEETRAAVEAALADAGLSVQVVDWQQASGLIGQFVFVLRIVLYLSLFIVFFVALIVINNAMMMATLDRVPEIGTMRAIGASRWTVVWLILAETLMLGAVAGVVGAAGAVGMLALLGTVGIPAPADVVVLLFAGPRLYPTVGAWHVGFGLLVVLVVALVAALYPAALASRVAPVVAMQGKE